jgi:O-Antigen ligase
MVTTLIRRAPFIGRLRFLLFDRHYNLTLRVSLIAVCLILTSLAAFMLRQFNPADPFSFLRQFSVVILMGLVTVTALIYRHMQAPALAVLIVSTLLHDGINTGTDTKISFTFFLLYLWVFIWLFKMIVVERQFKLQPSHTNLTVGLFIVAVVVSFIWSNAYVEAGVGYLYADKTIQRLMTGLVIIISAATHVLYANTVRSEKILKHIVWWFIGVGVVFGVLRLMTGEVPAPLNDRGQFPAWITAIILGQLFFNDALRWPLRVVLTSTVVMWLLITLGVGITWLSGWVPLLVVILTLTFFRSRKLLLVALLLMAVYGISKIETIQRTLTTEEQESGTSRALSWERTVAVTGDHFFLGTGPAGYHFYFTAYGYYDLNGVGSFNLSHNNYVDILAQTGLVGFTLWMLFWIAQGLNTWNLLRTPAPNGFLKGLKYTLVACYPAILVTMMLGDWLTPFPYTQTLAGIDYTIWAWMLTGLTVALYHVLREQNANRQLLTD